MECTLSVCGVAKTDVGYSNAPDADPGEESEPAKAAHSDGFKRAACKWAIGECLRETSPVGRGRYIPGRGFAGHRERGLIPRSQNCRGFRPTSSRTNFWMQLVRSRSATGSCCRWRTTPPCAAKSSAQCAPTIWIHRVARYGSGRRRPEAVVPLLSDHRCTAAGVFARATRTEPRALSAACVIV